MRRVASSSARQWLGRIRATALCACIGIAGCDSLEETILFNNTATPIRVTLSNPPRSEQDSTQPCHFEKPVVRQASSERDIRDALWQEASGLQDDPVKCQYLFTLEPGFATLLAAGHRCDRTTAYSISALAIEGPQKRVEWHGPDVVSQFKRHNGFCSYHYR